MSLVRKVIMIVLAILAIPSVGSTILATINYTRGTSALSDIQLDLSSLELREEGEPRVLITLNLDNGSSVDVKLETLNFSLFLNGNFMGSNYDPFTQRIANSSEVMAMDFVIPLQSLRLQHIKQARQQNDFSWSVRGRVKLLISFNGSESEVWLNIRELWDGSSE